MLFASANPLISLSTDGIAWLAAFICVLIPAKLASVHFKKNSRLFTMFVLFALGWALLLLYYSGEAPSEMLPAFAGFLLIYTAGLIGEEGEKRTRQDPSASRVGDIPRIALWLFLPLAVPTGWEVAAPHVKVIAVKPKDLDMVVATAFDILGYLLMLRSLKSLCGIPAVVFTGLVVVPYAALDIGFTVDHFMHHNGADCPLPSTMAPAFTYGFAGAKVLFTFFVTWFVIMAAGNVGTMPFSNKIRFYFTADRE